MYALLAEDERNDRGVRRRLWIAGILATLIVTLFVADRYVTLVQPNIERMQVRRDLQSVKTLEADVREVLESYGIIPEWVREKAVEFGAVGHVRDLWLVQLPKDLPVASVNADLKAIVAEYGGKAFAVENARLGEVALHITFRGKIRYSLLFTLSGDVRRASGRIVLLVDGLDEAPEDEIQTYLSSSEPVACVLEPTKDNVALHTRLREAGKEVVLHLHFQPTAVNDSRFSLSEDLDTETLASHLRYIIRNYPGTRHYYVTSERAMGMYLREVDALMNSQGYIPLESSVLSYLDRSAQEHVIIARMNDLAAIAMREGTAIGLVELRDGVMSFLDREISRLRKRGHDFVPLRGVLTGGAEKSP